MDNRGNVVLPRGRWGPASWRSRGCSRTEGPLPAVNTARSPQDRRPLKCREVEP